MLMMDSEMILEIMKFPNLESSGQLYLTGVRSLPYSKTSPDSSQVKLAAPDSQFGNFIISQIISESILWPYLEIIDTRSIVR